MINGSDIYILSIQELLNAQHYMRNLESKSNDETLSMKEREEAFQMWKGVRRVLRRMRIDNRELDKLAERFEGNNEESEEAI